MKALVLTDYKKFEYKEVPIPDYKTNEVLIKVKACGICGSDVHGMDGSTGRRIPPIIMGHEASGVIEKTGKDVTNWMQGDRVTFDSTIYPLNDWYTLHGMYNLSENRKVLGVSAKDFRQHGAFAEYVAVPEHILYKIPEKVSFEQAAMVEPVAVAMHAVSLSSVVLQDAVLVVGAGMIGLFIIQVLKNSNAGKIIAIDVDNEKLKLAKKFGAETILNPKTDNVKEKIFEITENRGVDIAFEAVGISETVATAIDNVRKGGTVTLVGNLSPKIELPLQSVVTRQIRLQGSCAIAGEYEGVLKLMDKGLIDVKTMISAIAPLSEGGNWFKKLYDKEPGLNKVILKP